MGTTKLGCGCSIATSMFGDRLILGILMRHEHVVSMQEELQATKTKLLELIKSQQ